MFPTQGMIVSDDVAQIGDALLTLVRHEVRQETPEATSRRRLETFVLAAQTLVARLAERQETLEQALDAVLRREALLRQQVEEVLRWQAKAEQDRIAAAVRWDASQNALSSRLDALSATILRQGVQEAYLEDQLTQAVARVARLEARTFPARWSRFVRRLRRILSWR